MEIPKNYTDVQLPFGMGEREIFGENRFQLFKHNTELRSLAKIFFMQGFRGPPKHAHGGAQAYVLDEVMGCTAWMHGIKVVAKSIEVKFILPCPLETNLQVSGVIVNQDTKSLSIEAQIVDSNNRILSSSSGIFRILDDETINTFSST